jgi:hypothetical protein
MGGHLMCHQCNDLDKVIERYRNILRSINDKQTEHGARVMIEELEARKAALHPPPPPVEHFVSTIGNVGILAPALDGARRGARRF